MAKKEERTKAFVLKAFDSLANRRDCAAGERFWSADYFRRTAHIPPRRDGLPMFGDTFPTQR